MNKNNKILYILCTITVFSIILTGCANIFKGSLSNDLDALLDSSDYNQVIIVATEILTTDPNNVEALLALGQAQAAKQDIIFSEIMTKFDNSSDSGEDKNISEMFAGVGDNSDIDSLLTACQNLNKANSLGNLSNDDKLVLAMVNAVGGKKLHDQLWNIDEDQNIITPLPTGNSTYKGNLALDVKGEDGEYFTGDASVDLTDSSADLINEFQQSAGDSGALDDSQISDVDNLKVINDRKIAMQKAIDGIATVGAYNSAANTYIDRSGVVNDMTNSSEVLLKLLLEDAYFH